MNGTGTSTAKTTPTVAFETLGCKLNQYETDSIATTLENRGYQVVPFRAGADAYVVNSCTVTNKADRKSRNTVYRARRLGGRQAVVVLTGCFTESRRRDISDNGRGSSGKPAQDAVANPDRGATYIVDNSHKNTIPDLLEAHFRGEIPEPEALKPSVFGFSTPRRIFHTRTNIKVQDGCDNFCTFCIIPFVRGRAGSRPVADILTEASEAVAGGSRELVLTGVNMSRYRADDGVDFVSMVEQILALPGEFRLRISSLEPDGLDRRFTELFRHPKMCPHLHLCAQSGSDRILLAMRRMYTTRQFRHVAAELREIDPQFNITTDIIVGFPGESEEDMAHTLSFIGELNFGHVHTFPFSVRNGTKAARMDNQIPHQITNARAETVRTTAESEKRRYRSTLVDRPQRVLTEKVERRADGTWTGRGLGEYYVPVRINSQSELRPNTFYTVTPDALSEGLEPELLATT
ncbi:MAG: tRNA (N(6)-L-threonylcarbamoyladenosine(37)-C(2))-methylthiotransferase MtaB [Alkalispirochaeta sp.]